MVVDAKRQPMFSGDDVGLVEQIAGLFDQVAGLKAIGAFAADDAPAAEGGHGVQHPVLVRAEGQGRVGAGHLQPQFPEEPAGFCGRRPQSVQGGLHANVTDLGDLPHHVGEIIGQGLADGVQLQGDGGNHGCPPRVRAVHAP